MVMSAMLGSKPPADFSCPPLASRCAWREYTTLSICSEFQSISEKMSSNCTRSSDELAVDCALTFPGGHKFLYPLSVSMKKAWDGNWKARYRSQSLVTSTRFNGGVAFAGVNISQVRFAESTNALSGITGYSGNMFWCSRTTRNLTIDAGGLSSANTDNEPLTYVDRLYWDGPTMMWADGPNYHANSTGTDFWIDMRADNVLWDFLGSIFLIDNKQNNSDPPGRSQVSENAFRNLLLFDDPGSVIANVSRSISSHINFVGGDNANATNWVGTAYANVPRYTVRWAWLILPLAETVLVTALMGLTILLSGEGPLWRSSALATLFHSLEGGELNDGLSAGCRTDACLERAAAGFQASLSSNRTDHPKFIVKRKETTWALVN
jgi:hypothetical protein